MALHPLERSNALQRSEFRRQILDSLSEAVVVVDAAGSWTT